jgi:hypothetical protein
LYGIGRVKLDAQRQRDPNVAWPFSQTREPLLAREGPIMSIVEERPERALTIREFCEAEHMLLELDHLSARLGANSQQKGRAEGAAPQRACYAAGKIAAARPQ